MTDKEIIKGIEICLRDVTTEGCIKCPFQEFGGECMNEMFRNALNLINRQKAEIEELTEKHHNECRQIAEYDNESKLFAEALKAELKNLSKVHLFGTTFALVGESFIDGFVAKYEKGSEENA